MLSLPACWPVTSYSLHTWTCRMNSHLILLSVFVVKFVFLGARNTTGQSDLWSGDQLWWEKVWIRVMARPLGCLSNQKITCKGQSSCHLVTWWYSCQLAAGSGRFFGTLSDIRKEYTWITWLFFSLVNIINFLQLCIQENWIYIVCVMARKLFTNTAQRDTIRCFCNRTTDLAWLSLLVLFPRINFIHAKRVF